MKTGSPAAVPSNEKQGPTRFPNTRWSLILEAREGNEEDLNTLFQAYWFPVYGSFYDKVRNHHDAEDLTQRLFSEIVRRNDLESLAPVNGRFRSFLKAAIKNLHCNFVAERTAKKRGGNASPLSIDSGKAQSWLDLESFEDNDPGRIFDQRWILSVLESARRNLRFSMQEQGKGKLYEELEELLLPRSRASSYAEIASRLNQAEGTIRVKAFRIREQYRYEIRSCIRETVGNAKEAEEEIKYLSSLAGFSFSPGSRH